MPTGTSAPEPRNEDISRSRCACVRVRSRCRPVSAQAQDDVHLRNDCWLASQILRTGYPAPHRDWAWGVIPSCVDSARAVLAGVWRNHPASVEPWRLWGVSHRVRDARLTRAVIFALRDRTQPREVRTVAARVLASHAAPNLVVLATDMALLTGDSTRSVRISVSHSSVRQGLVPVTAAVIAEIRAALESVASDDCDSEVRAAAKAIAEQIRSHLL